MNGNHITPDDRFRLETSKQYYKYATEQSENAAKRQTFVYSIMCLIQGAYVALILDNNGFKTDVVFVVFAVAFFVGLTCSIIALVIANWQQPFLRDLDRMTDEEAFDPYRKTSFILGSAQGINRWTAVQKAAINIANVSLGIMALFGSLSILYVFMR